MKRLFLISALVTLTACGGANVVESPEPAETRQPGDAPAASPETVTFMDREWMKYVDLSDFVGTWEAAYDEELENKTIKFDIRPGADGRYFGYILNGIREPSGIAVWGVDRSGMIVGHVDEGADGVYNAYYDPSDEDSAVDWNKICRMTLESQLHCVGSTTTKLSSAPTLGEELGKDLAQAPSGWTPMQDVYGFYASSTASAIVKQDALFERQRAEEQAAERAEAAREAAAAAEPVGTAPAAGGGAACWEREQNRISAEIESRMRRTANICPNAKLSVDLWSDLSDAARYCGMPSAVVQQAEANLAQSRAVVNNSCLR